MLIQCPSITTEQVKVALLPILFQREASLRTEISHKEKPKKVKPRGSISKAGITVPEKLKKGEIDTVYLKGTELWPIDQNKGGSTHDSDIGAGWVPIYISFCSLPDHLLYEDDRYVVITDHHIHVTKPILWDRKVDFQSAFECSIPINRIVDVRSEARKCHAFHAPFQHTIIKYKEMSLIKPPGSRIPMRNYSVSHSVETLTLRSSIKVWELSRYITRARVNSNIRNIFTSAVYHDSDELDRYYDLEGKLLSLQRMDPAMRFKHHLKPIEKKSTIMRKIAEIANANRAVKTAFWKSLELYKLLIDDIESCFMVVKKFLDQCEHPRAKRRSEAEIASTNGLKYLSNANKPDYMSEERALLAIRYLRKCLQLLTIFIFDTEQVPIRMTLFQQLSPYGFVDFVKILVAGVSIEAYLRGPTIRDLNLTKSGKGIENSEKTTFGLTKYLDDLKVLPRASIASNQSSGSGVSEEQVEAPPPPSPWATVPVRFIPGAKNRNRSAIQGTAAAFASWTDSRTGTLPPSSLDLTGNLESISSIYENDSMRETSAQTSSRSIERTSTGSRSSYQRKRASKISQTSNSATASFSSYSSLEKLSNGDSIPAQNVSFIYTGDSARMDLWKAKYHRNTKSAFKIQNKIEEDLKRDRSRKQKQVLDDLQSNFKPTTPLKVKFDVLDVTTLLSLPLPPLPVERAPAIDPWEECSSDDNDSCDTNPRLNNQAATMLKSAFSFANINMQKSNLSNGYPSFDQFDAADLHPKRVPPQTKVVHSTFRLCAIDSAALLWELGFLSKLESNAAAQFDTILREHWVGNLQYKNDGWFPVVGGMAPCFDFIVTILHKDFDTETNTFQSGNTSASLEDLSVSIKETRTTLFTELLPPRVLSVLYRVVLLINHILVDVKGPSLDLSFWDAEFKYLLTPEIIRKRFGHDARPIAQSVSDELLKLTDFFD